MSSHDVVDFIRKIGGRRRAGHSGTLDRAAAGVLAVCVGRATRIAEYLSACGKEYRVEIALGETTSTGDATGYTTREEDASALSFDDLRKAVGRFTGRIIQRVPALSAKKFAGMRSYDIVRSGGVPPERTTAVYVERIDVVEFRAGRRATAVLDVACSAGTYIRALCSDIGQALGCGAHMSFLLRTRTGPFAIEDAMTLEELGAAASGGRLCELVVGSDRALGFLKGFEIDRSGLRKVSQGRAPENGDIIKVMEPSVSPAAGSDTARLESSSDPERGELVRLLRPEGGLAAVARATTSCGRVEFSLEKVFL
jgi:tRNA pseudouridine55 synthase